MARVGLGEGRGKGQGGLKCEQGRAGRCRIAGKDNDTRGRCEYKEGMGIWGECVPELGFVLEDLVQAYRIAGSRRSLNIAGR